MTAETKQRKGEQTKSAIVETALDLAARDGLEGLTIGLIADRMHMSKSGVFAHFGSREDLQIAVVWEYHSLFQREVFDPSMQLERGLPRLRALFENWIKRVTVELDSGCLYISGAVEYDDRPGAVGEALHDSINIWRNALLRAAQMAIDAGHLRADTDPSQIVFEMYGAILVLHHDARFLKIPGAQARARAAFERTIAACIEPQAPVQAVNKASKPSTTKRAA